MSTRREWAAPEWDPQDGQSPGEASAQRRRQLLDAADRVVRRDGPQASMSAIAREAGITKPILYRWFGDKHGLYSALAERHTGHLLDLLYAALRQPASKPERTRMVVSAYVDYVLAAPEVYRFLMYRAVAEEPAVRRQVAGFVRRLGEVLAHGLCLQFDLPPDDPAMQTWGAALVGAVQSAVDRWLHEQDLPREVFLDRLTELLCRGWVSGP